MNTKLSSNESIKRMQSLLDTARILNSEQDTDTILNTLLATCLNLIPGGDLGAIFLYNKSSNRLDMRAYSGMGDSVKTVSLKTNESMTGIAFTRKEPVLFPSSEAVTKAMNEMQPSNLKRAIDGGVNPERLNGSICCPLMYHDQPLGVLVIDNINKNNPLREVDVEFLEDISVQATLAIKNAQILEKEKQTNKILLDYTKIIERERNNYQYSLETHKRFTNMMLEGSTIKDIILESSKIIKQDMFLIDRLYTIREYSLIDASKLQSLQSTVYSIIAPLNRGELIIDHNDFQEKSFNIFPITVNKEILAWLCVVATQAALTELNKITIERTTSIIALEMLKTNEIITREQTLKGDYIESLINHPTDDYVRKLSERFGLEQRGHFITMTLRFTFKSEKDKDRLSRNTLGAIYRRLNTILAQYTKASFSMIKGSSFIVIIDCKEEDYKLLCDKILKDFHREYKHLTQYIPLTANYTGAVSQPFGLLKSFKEAHEDVDMLLMSMDKFKQHNRVHFYDGLNLKQFLSKASKEELEKYTNTIFRPFESLKHQSKEDLFLTLETYIKSNCNWTYTKNTLHIHGNTLTYRLSRISDILDMDLNNYQDRLKIQVAFEIISLLE